MRVERIPVLDGDALAEAYQRYEDAPAWAKTEPLMALLDVVGNLDAWSDVDELLDDLEWLFAASPSGGRTSAQA